MQWLNDIGEVNNVSVIYNSRAFRRIFRLSGLVALLVGCSASQAAGHWISESFNAGKEGELCRVLHKRLNEMSKGKNQNCMYDAIESYTGFTDPPWDELDPREHFELLVKLMRFDQEGTGPSQNSDSAYRVRAENFITRDHGEMQIWKTRLLSDFDTEGTLRAREQIIVKLTNKWGTSVSSEGCPAKSSHGWVRSTFIVSPDLSGPDPSLQNGTGRWSFTSTWPVLFDGKAVLINSYSVHWPSAACIYQFVENPSQS
jgi:hypothetical protein